MPFPDTSNQAGTSGNGLEGAAFSGGSSFGLQQAAPGDDPMAFLLLRASRWDRIVDRSKRS